MLDDVIKLHQSVTASDGRISADWFHVIPVMLAANKIARSKLTPSYGMSPSKLAITCQFHNYVYWYWLILVLDNFGILDIGKKKSQYLT